MTAVAGAVERLTQSRERLRLAIHARTSPSKTSPHPPESVAAFASDWLSSVKAIPGANLLLEFVEDWWSKQPLHMAFTQLAKAANGALRPVSQKHPYALVFGAAAVGALLVLARPWRWISTSALVAGLVPAIHPLIPPPSSGRAGALVSATSTSPLGNTYIQRGWSNPRANAITRRPGAASGQTPTGQPSAGAMFKVGSSEFVGAGIVGCAPTPTPTSACSTGAWPQPATATTNMPMVDLNLYRISTFRR